MDDITIYIALATMLSLALGFILIFRKSQSNKSEEEVEARPRRLPGPGEDGAPVGGGPNRAAANRNARARMRAAQVRRDVALEEEDEDDELAELGEEIALPDGKIGKKKQMKLQAKADKRANREAEEREREERRERTDKANEARRKEDEKQADIEAQQEEEERKQREEKEQKEQEEYELLKAGFEVQEEGYDQIADQEKERDLYNEFISYIKCTKVVVLEDLAARFKLKTQAVIDRLTDMQKDGTLTGVIDDRGKFIYISMSELEGMAKFIKQRGRISISELAESSHTLINLIPDTKVEC